MYSAYKLNNQGHNIQPELTPSLIWNQSVVPYTVLFLTCIQISQEAGQVVWYSHLLKNFPQFVVIHIVKGFGIVNKADVDVFLKHSCFFNDPTDVGNLISGSSAFSKTSLNIWKFSIHVLLRLAWTIFSITLLACEMSAIVFEQSLAFLFLGLEWNLPYPFLWPLLSFPYLLAYWVQHFHRIIF